jgi:hypothetical protein
MNDYGHTKDTSKSLKMKLSHKYQWSSFFDLQDGWRSLTNK